MELEEKKKQLESLLNQKVQQLQNIEGIRNQLSSEILKLQGKIELLEEQILESSKEKTAPKVQMEESKK